MTHIPIELKACPFCGSHLREDGPEWHHEMADCPLSDAVFDEQQVSEWNARAPDPALKECVEALEECRLIVANLPHGEELLLAKIDALIAKVGGRSGERPLSMCAHGADKGSYCGYCGGYSQGAQA